MVDLKFSDDSKVNWGSVAAIMLSQKVATEEKIDLVEDGQQIKGGKKHGF